MSALPAVDELSAQLLDELEKAPPSADALWHVSGPMTAGKSTLLRRLAEGLEERGMIPILVAPPPKAIDTGAVALAQAAVRAEHAAGPGVLSEWSPGEGSSWEDKLGGLTEWMRKRVDRIVVLCDDPNKWPSGGKEEVHFAGHAFGVAWSLLGSDMPCRRVLVGESLPGLRPRHRRELDVRPVTTEWLQSEAWGELLPFVTEIGDRLTDELAQRTPLEWRLLVGLAALSGGVDTVVRYMSARPSRFAIMELFARAVQNRAAQGDPYLRTAWSRLAIARRPVTGALVAHVTGQAPDQVTDAILKHCLLYPDDNHYRLHWSLARLARDEAARFPTQPPAPTHRLLAEHYTAQFRRLAADVKPEALLEELEAFHHASMVGDDALLRELRPWFADQLDALGRIQSRDQKRYEDAAATFERACQWEPEDDYAHHYLAFNLDVVAAREDEVEEHYQKAIALAPSNTWWHSRWIRYLITRGDTAGAREAWSNAREALGLPSPATDEWVYINLHMRVARLLVHRAQLDFATDVLDEIPASVRNEHAGLKAINRRLIAFLEAQRVGAVFPLTVPPEDWWNGPHLFGRTGARQKEHTVARWMPGRVNEVRADEVYLHVAFPPEGQNQPQYGFLTIKATDFDEWTRDERAGELSEGRYVELAWWGDSDDPIIRVHPDEPFEDPDMPRLFPDPTRYLRAFVQRRKRQ